MCILSLSLFQNPFVFARTRIGWNERATERLKAPFAFGSSALLSLRFFIFFFLVCAEKTRLFLPYAREKFAARWVWVCFIWWDAKIRTGGCDCFCIVVNVFFADIMVVSWCGGVLRTPTTRRRTRDFGPKRKDLFGTVCVQMSPATKNVTKSRILTSSFLFFSKKQQNTNLQTWVACTAKEKGCPNRPSLSNDRRRSGAKPPRMKSKTWSRRWRRKAWRRRKSASSWEITTASRKCPRWPTPKSCASWRVKVWRRLCRKICTVWSRKPCPCASTWRETARTWTPSFDWFWSNPESTDWRDTTDSRRSWSRTGGTSLRQPPRSWRSKCVSLHANIYY